MKNGLFTKLCFFALAAASFFLAPVAGAEEANVCIECHQTMTDPPFGGIVEKWHASIHGQMGVKCNDCHGGNPTDMMLAMDRDGGFKGKPAKTDVPAFCGRCHIGVYDNYKTSAHQIALNKGTGPNCVTCHTNHTVTKVTSDLINEETCGKTECHTFERAKEVKDALAGAEKLITRLEGEVPALEKEEMKTADVKEKIFAARQSLRALSHVLSINDIHEKTKETITELEAIQKEADGMFTEIAWRKRLGVIVLLVCFGWLFVSLFYRRAVRDLRKKD